MKKKFLSVLLTLAMVLAMIPMSTGGAWAAEEGTQANPWKIGTPTDTAVTAYIDGNTLYIEGDGDIKDFEFTSAPWVFNDVVTTINIGNNISAIGDNSFEYLNKLSQVNIPDGVTRIGKNAFDTCSTLTNISLPNSLVSVDDRAFNNCIALASVEIPENVSTIGEGAFCGCEALASVTIRKATPPAFGDSVFDYCSNELAINVPFALVDTYKNASGWRNYSIKIKALPITIADILPENFPTTEADAWVNEHDAKAYIDGDKLSAGSVKVSLSGNLVKDGNNYSYTGIIGTFKFNMDSGNLQSIELSGVLGEDPNGKYEPPIIEPAPSIGYFVYDVAQYNAILAEAQKQQALIDAQQAGTKPAEPTTEPTTEKLTVSEAKALVETMVPTVRTENQARGIKVFVKDSEEVTKFKAAGYKVLYDFYRAESKTAPKAEDYKITTVVNKEEPWYLNNAAKKGKKYYYKAVAKVYDANGELVAETELTQGKYGVRTR